VSYQFPGMIGRRPPTGRRPGFRCLAGMFEQNHRGWFREPQQLPHKET
jgi:hypothetical protein